MSLPPTSLLRRAAFLASLAAALVLLTGATAGVNTPHSGWYSGNPLLGSNTLTDLACSGQTCYASGHFGTLLKSTDAGATWAGIVTGLTLDLARVRLAGGSPDRAMVGGGCAVYRSDDGGDTFFRLPFTARDFGCQSGIRSFSFPTERTGYLLLNSARLLATEDGGRTFSRRTPPPGGANDILCTAEKTCFTAGPSGLIQRTNDGGVSWTQVANFSATGLFGLERADPLTLYAVGFGLAVVKSVDGGATWTRKTVRNVPFGNLRTIRCANALQCLITTEAGNQLVRTSDGGETYASVVPSTDPTFAVAFVPPSRAVAAGAFGSVEISGDAGGTWTAAGSRIAGSFTVLAAAVDSPASEPVAYAGGQNGILARTANGGQSWVNVSPPTETLITALAASGADRVYVLAADQSLQRSDNGGQSYRLLNPGVGQPATIVAPSRDRLLVIGRRGVIRSSDGGETFATVRDPAVRGKPLTAGDLAGGAVVAFSPRVAAMSSDGGVSWRRIPLPRKRAVRDLDFASPQVGFLLDTRGELWRTANAGRSWRALATLGTSRGRSLEFADPRNGYVSVFQFGSLGRAGSGPHGFVLRTADGGRSWHPQLVGHDVLAAVMSGGATDFALSAGGSTLYATTSRGDVGAPQKLALSARPGSLNRPGRIVVGGRLAPADGGEEIVVARYAAGRWSVRLARAAANGAFAVPWRVDRTSVFVAQVLGDADHAGTGTEALTVSVRPRSRR